MKKILRILLVMSLMLVVAIVAMVLVSRKWVSSDDPIQRTDAFPILSGTNLLLEKVIVPDALSGKWRLVVVAYDSDQQVFVDKWLLPLETLNEDYPDLAGYYLPLLPQDTTDAALPIIGGMTLAAKNDRDRGRTIVVFTDVDAFNKLVGIPDTDEIQLFLLDETGKILWQGSGGYSHDTLVSLENRLIELSSPDTTTPLPQ